jgi:CDP-diacylglycerol--glycerol-3-phosphate 3-phosphatidyltransferase
MNLPNRLTVGRLGLTAMFVGLLTVPVPHGKTLALAVFAAAAFTDYLDGHLARKHGWITNFGKLMDPLADKVLMAAGFVMLIEPGLIPAWAVVTILAREFLVTGLRLLAGAQGKILAAEGLGKHKTAWQIATLVYLLAYLASADPALAWSRGWFSWPPAGPEGVGRALVAVTLGLTVWSGWSYAWTNRSVFADGTGRP